MLLPQLLLVLPLLASHQRMKALSSLAALPAAPPEWAAGVAEGSLMLAASMPDPDDQLAVLYYSAPIGNGLVATVVDSDKVFLGGIYNSFNEVPGKWHPSFDGWRVNGTARATLPATTSAIAPANVSASVFALDVRRGVLLARYSLGPAGCAEVERRVYAPRLGSPLLVTELEVLQNHCTKPLSIPLRNNFQAHRIRADGSNASIGADNDDFELEVLPLPYGQGRPAGDNIGAFGGKTRGAAAKCFGVCPLLNFTLNKDGCGAANYDSKGNRGGPTHTPYSNDAVCTPADPATRPTIAVVYDRVPTVWNIAAGATSTSSFVSAYGTSLNSTGTPLEQASAVHSNAHNLAASAKNGLFAAHVLEMTKLWTVQQGGAAILVDGNAVLASATWSALHSLTSSQAAEWGQALPPQNGFGCAGLWAGGAQ